MYRRHVWQVEGPGGPVVMSPPPPAGVCVCASEGLALIPLHRSHTADPYSAVRGAQGGTQRAAVGPRCKAGSVPVRSEPWN